MPLFDGELGTDSCSSGGHLSKTRYGIYKRKLLGMSFAAMRVLVCSSYPPGDRQGFCGLLSEFCVCGAAVFSGFFFLAAGRRPPRHLHMQTVDYFVASRRCQFLHDRMHARHAKCAL